VIQVVKYIGAAVMGMFLFLSNIAETPVAFEKGREFARAILIREGALKSDRSAFSAAIFLEQTAFELSSFLVADQRWLTRLIEQGIIRGAYLDTKDQSIVLGESFTPLRNADGGYHMEENALHFVHRSTENDLFLDALVNTNRFSSFIQPNIREPRFVLLYDLLQGEEVFIHGRPWELPDMVYRRLKQPDTGDFYMVTNKIIAVKMLSGTGEGFAVVSLYPIWSWGRFTFVFALIVICVLSILLLVLSIRYNLSGRLPFWKGALVMADENETKDVVNEIDREISDLFEDEASLEQQLEPVIKKGDVDVKKEQQTEEKAAEELEIQKPTAEEVPEPVPVGKTDAPVGEGVEQDLEKDGIIIKKG
jgi:hypothetical protein